MSFGQRQEDEDAWGQEMDWTHIQGQIQAQDIALLQQRLEINILGTLFKLRAQPRTVMVADAHTKGASLGSDIAANTTHAQDSKDLALGVVTQSRQRLAAPVASTQGRHRNG